MRPITVVTIDATSGVQESDWVRFDDYANAPVAVQVTVYGTATYTLYATLQDPNDPIDPTPLGAMVWLPVNNGFLINATTTQQANFIAAPRYAKLVQTNGNGVVQATFIQYGSVPY